MPLQATSGAASYDGFGGGVPFTPTYIEDVFSTWLYTGTGSGTQTITNGIDLAGEGGLVWIKSRTATAATTGHALFDTARGRDYGLATQLTGAQQGPSPVGSDFASFNSNGFTVSANNFYWALNPSGVSGSMVSWTFRKQPKFFDVVTWTGNGANPRQIAHNLGSVPGCIIVKSTTRAENWTVYHRSLGNAARMALNTTDAQVTGTGVWGSTTPTSTHFTVSADNLVNFNGDGYVAYLFAHDAGGFGLTGTDNVISCGSYTGGAFDGVNFAAVTTTLGFEPQWVLIKEATGGNGWFMFDNMRGIATGGVDPRLSPNSANQEFSSNWIDLTSTGFTATLSDGSSGINNGSSNTYIYIAIRRGPMKTPTTGTSVFTPSTVGATANVTVGFPSDTFWSGQTSSDWRCFDRLRSGFELATNTTAAEGTFNYYPTYIDWDSNSVWNQNLQNAPVTNFWFRRAPGFFDVVCYTGTGSATTQAHNLGVAPELMIVKRRNTVRNWAVYVASVGTNKYLKLNLDFTPETDNAVWNNTAPTSTVFSLGTAAEGNGSGDTYVAYLFATVAGVSKVGTYTGTGALQTINCGFTGGARFVLIKRTDSTGDWFVFNSANGISSGNDPYRILNGTTLTSGTNYVDTTSVGFQVTAAAPAGLNASGGTYIFLAIA